MRIVIGWAVLLLVGIALWSRHKRVFCPHCQLDLGDCECDRESIEAAARQQTWWNLEKERLSHDRTR